MTVGTIGPLAVEFESQWIIDSLAFLLITYLFESNFTTFMKIEILVSALLCIYVQGLSII